MLLTESSKLFTMSAGPEAEVEEVGPYCKELGIDSGALLTCINTGKWGGNIHELNNGAILEIKSFVDNNFGSEGVMERLEKVMFVVCGLGGLNFKEVKPKTMHLKVKRLFEKKKKNVQKQIRGGAKGLQNFSGNKISNCGPKPNFWTCTTSSAVPLPSAS